ncbi:MAG: hypothetical protein AAB966_04360, partial [Patescibacteria group bacterium]
MSARERDQFPLPESHSVFPLVFIAEDCRDEDDHGPDGNLSGRVGVLLGKYELPEEKLNHINSVKAFQSQEPLDSKITAKD